MTSYDHLVLVLDDELSVRTALERLLKAHGFRVRLHADADDLFAAGLPSVPSCLLLDHHLGGGVTGVDVHAELQRRGWDLATVFLTAHWSVQSVVSAMRAGADGFLTKPYDPDELVHAVSAALDQSAAEFQTRLKAAELRSKAATLSPRERQILGLVVAGLLNKQIADQLGLAVITVKVHRGRAMGKLGARTPAELARFVALAGLTWQ